MKRINWISILLLPLWIGCDEVDYMSFHDVDRIQIESPGETIYNFFYEDRESVQRDTAYVRVQALGGGRPYPREIVLKQITEYDESYEYDDKGNVIDTVYTEYMNKAVAGVHYLASDASGGLRVELPADSMEFNVPVILLRDTSLQSGEVRLCLELEATEDFQLGMRARLSKTIIIVDKLFKPDNWSGIFQQYFGAYSEVKHEFMVSVLKQEINDEWINSLYSDFTLMISYRNVLINQLNAFNNDPENLADGTAPLRDENGNIITFDR